MFMISSTIQHFFNKIQPNMIEQEKKWQRKYDRRNQAKKISEIFGISSWPPSIPDLSPLITLYGGFWKQNKFNFPSKFQFA